MTSGANEIVINKATPSDINGIKKIADAHRKELGFVRRPSLLESINRAEVFVARQNGNIIGFVEYHHRKDEQTTLYNIAIEPAYRNTGVARNLIKQLIQESKERQKTRILLKCPNDLAANSFYEKFGFELYQVEPGKKRKLNIWQWLI